MTRLKDAPTKPEIGLSAETDAPPAESPPSMDSPKLSAMHEKTRDAVNRVMGKDPKKFEEKARAQVSGQ